MLSVWKPGSDVLRINAAAGRERIAVSRETIEVLQAARRGSELTDGKFDVTFGALADIWKFDHDRDNRVPTATEIAARLPLVDYRAVEIDAAAGTIFLTRLGSGYISAALARVTPSIALWRCCARGVCTISWCSLAATCMCRVHQVPHPGASGSTTHEADPTRASPRRSCAMSRSAHQATTSVSSSNEVGAITICSIQIPGCRRTVASA